ncbi:MAG TPA: hypothetical protein VI076_09860 [Actinopolymorphaceae bacterium]
MRRRRAGSVAQGQSDLIRHRCEGAHEDGRTVDGRRELGVPSDAHAGVDVGPLVADAASEGAAEFEPPVRRIACDRVEEQLEQPSLALDRGRHRRQPRHPVDHAVSPVPPADPSDPTYAVGSHLPTRAVRSVVLVGDNRPASTRASRKTPAMTR